MLALWMCAGAVRENETARWRLAIAGIALGCGDGVQVECDTAGGAAGAGFLVGAVLSQAVAACCFRGAAPPVAGMSLVEAGVWLGAVPLAVYARQLLAVSLSTSKCPVIPAGLIALHREMLDLQTQVLQPHPYQSVWYEWTANWRVIWYLYEVADGAQRGVMLIGNPLTMLAGLPALAWCGWAGWKDRRWDALAVAVLYAVSLALWMIAPKPVQFYFHYLLPGCFLSAALALATQRLWERGERIVPWALVLGAAGFFAYWWPILTAAPLEDGQAFLRWAWWDSWR